MHLPIQNILSSNINSSFMIFNPKFFLDLVLFCTHIRQFYMFNFCSNVLYAVVMASLCQPEAFVKVRPRCEAPRRDMVYPVNYTPCRYVRISCLRGNPIAIFFIQVSLKFGRYIWYTAPWIAHLYKGWWES